MNQKLLLLVASNCLAHAARVTENSIRESTEGGVLSQQPFPPQPSSMGGLGGNPMDMGMGGQPFQQAPQVSVGQFQGSQQHDPYAVGQDHPYGGRYEVGSKREEIVHRPNRFWGFIKGTGKRFYRFYGGLGRGTLNIARFVFPWIGDRVIDAGFEVGSGVAYAGRAAGRGIRSGYREMKAEWAADMRASSSNAKWKRRAASHRAQSVARSGSHLARPGSHLASSPMIGRAQTFSGMPSPMTSMATPVRANTYLELASESAGEDVNQEDVAGEYVHEQAEISPTEDGKR